MGTSINYTTPTRGNWSSAKRAITAFARGGNQSSAVGRALGNVARSLSGGGSGGGSHAGGLITPSARNGMSGGAGFLSSALREGVQTALQQLGIRDTEGLDGIEIIDRISEALVGDRLSLDQEIAITALRETLLEILGPETETFDAALKGFMSEQGLRGFIERFLNQYILERVWQHLSDSARQRIASEDEVRALHDGLERLCSAEISATIEQMSGAHGFENVDWLGNQGRSIADGIADGIENSLRELI